MPEDQEETFELLPRPVRAWLYRVTTGVAPLLIAYGVVDGNRATLWLGAVASVLGTGTAAVYTRKG